MKKIYTMECIAPTSTLVANKRYKVVEYPTGEDTMKVVNESGFIITVNKVRFSNLEEQIEDMNEIKCVNSATFRNISTGKTYTVLSEEKSFYLIKNDKKIVSKYGKKYFVRVRAEEKPAPKPVGNKCIIPTIGLTYHKNYKLSPVNGDPTMVFVKNDEGEKIKVLRKRFK